MLKTLNWLHLEQISGYYMAEKGDLLTSKPLSIVKVILSTDKIWPNS